MSNRYYIALASALMLTLLTAIKSSAADLQFRHYTTDEGLPSNCVRDLLQSEDGYMWFATDGGVVRFDGYDFRRYRLHADLDSLPDDNYAMSLCSHNRELLVGTDSHLYRYSVTEDAFQPLTITCGGKNIHRLNVHQIVSDGTGSLWVVVEGQGVYRLPPDSKGKDAVLYPFPNFNNIAVNIFIDSRGDVWAYSNQNDGELMRLDKSEDKFKRVGTSDIWYRSLAMAEDANHNLWLGTWDEGLVCLNPFTLQVVYKTSVGDRRYFRHIHSILPMVDGRIMVGSDAGLVIYDAAIGTLNHYEPDTYFPESISDRFVYPIHVDREGGVWIGTYYGGVNYLAPALKNFERIQYRASHNGAGWNIISYMLEDKKGDVWIASDDGGLNRYSPVDGSLSHIKLSYRDNGLEVAPTNMHALCLDGDDLWVGTYASGVFVYNTLTGATKHYASDDSDQSSLRTNSSYSIIKDRLNRLWVATGSWVNIYNRGTDDFRRVKDLKSQIIDIVEDIDGSLWFATQGAGLWRYNPVRGDWKNYIYTLDQSSIAHNHVNSICLGQEGSLYVATVDGLCRYDRASDSFERIQLQIPNKSLLSVIEADGMLWMATETCLVKYDPTKGCDVFTKGDGMSSSNFMPNSIMKTRSGKLLVGSRSGITAFYPHQIKSNTVPPQVVLTNLDIPTDCNNDATSHIQRGKDDAYMIVLHPEDYTFSISFAALSYTNPEKNQYAYKLDGFDKDWITTGSKNVATYTNLPAGQYTLRVKASNGDNVWNEAGTSVEIKVLAPWYMTWPMKVLYVLIIIAIVLLAIRTIMLRKDKKHKVEIGRINSDKEIELYQAKLSFFTMIAHEIRTPVSLIIGPLEKIMRSSERVSPAMSRDLNIIERNSQRLLTLVNQLLDFKKVESQSHNLKFKHTALRPLLESVADRFRPSMEQKGITLDVISTVDDAYAADIDAEAITKMVSNLLNNARKFTRDHVSLSLNVSKSTDSFIIIVTDNGVGISKADQSKIFRPFYQVDEDGSHTHGGTGLGLSIVQNVVEGHGGSIKIDSALGCGTSFIVTLPVKQLVTEAEKGSDVSDQAEVAEQQETVAAPKDAVKPTMLVVDDNEELCTFIANNFDDKYTVLTAADGIEALDILEKKDVSVIISDWMMPRLDGLELCKAVRTNRNISHIPFILLTAKTDNMSRIEGLNYGADAYVDKPFSLQVLEARINNLMNMRDLLRKKFSQVPLEPLTSLAPNPADNEILKQLTEVIEDNFSNPDLDIDFLASKLEISRSGLYNKIKSLIDVTPNELIRITRLKHAAKLLTENKYRINEVCYMVGFNSTSYFAKCFQKQFGMTPTDFISHIANTEHQ